MPEYYDPFLAGIVRIHDAQERILGTGFVFRLVPPLAMIATCTHVVQEALAGTPLEAGKTIALSFDVDFPHRLYDATIFRWLPAHEEDIAILTVEGLLPPQARSLPLARATVAGNRQISVYGYPIVTGFLGSWAHSPFCRVGTRQTSTGKRWLQLESSTITGGFSGAPVWDDSRRKTIGIVSRIGQKDNYGKMADLVYALPIELLQEMIPELSVALPSPFHPAEPCAEGELEQFFGDVESMDLLAKHLNQPTRFVAVLGPAGCGKTSLVQADLIPKVRRGMIGEQENWSILKLAFSVDPFQDLENAGLKGANTDLVTSIHTWCQQEQSKSLLLILDQFENMLLYAPKAIQIQLLTQLCQIITRNIATIMIILRDDLYHLLAVSIPFLRLVEENLVNVVAPLSRERLVRMAQDRAKVYGISFDPAFLSDLTEHLLQVHTQTPQTGFLSAYEHALAQLWQEKQDTASISLSTQDPPALHLDAWAENVFLAFNEQDQLLARHLFLQLVQLEKRQEDIPDVRRFLPINTLCQHEQERDLIYRLVEQGLLAIFRDGSTHEEIVSIAQSTLLATWLRLNAWLEEKNHFEQWYASFAQRLATTSALSPTDLQEAVLWLERYPDRFAPGMKDVLQSNQQRLLRAQEAEEKSRQLVKQQTITKARQLAHQVEALYNQASGQMEEAISVALEALHLVHCPETDQCIRNCLDRLPKPLTVYRVEASLVAVDVNAICGIAAFARADGIIFLLHLSTGQWKHMDCQASVRNLMISAQGSYVLIAQKDGAICIYHTATFQKVSMLEASPDQVMTMSPDERLFALAQHHGAMSDLVIYTTPSWGYYERFLHEPRIEALTFRPDGHSLALRYTNGSVKLRDMTLFPHPSSLGSAEPLFQAIESQAICQMEFSPGGHLLALADQGERLSLWELEKRTNLFTYQLSSPVQRMAWSPNGSYLATASEDGTVTLFQLSHEQSPVCVAFERSVEDLIFSFNEELLAIALSNGDVALWDTMTSQRTVLLIHNEPIQRVYFSMHEYDLFTVTQSGAVTHWNTITSGHQVRFLTQERPYTLCFSRESDQPTLLVVGQKGHIKVWERQGHFCWHPGVAHTLPYAGKMLAANASLTYICGGANPTEALVGDIWGRTPPITLSCESTIRAAALSLSGHSVALVEEKQISIWSTQTGQCYCKTPTRTTPKHLSFSQDEHALVFVEGACDATLWLWKDRYPKQSLFPQHSVSLTAITCNSDARSAVTADTHGLIRVWRWNELEEHGGVENLYDIQQPGTVSSIMFQTQGRWLATASDDQTARVYETATGTQRYVFSHRAAVSHMLFSHDGRCLITASKDQTITIWNLSDGQQLTRFICPAQIQTLLLSPDDTVLATIDEERWITLRLWRTEDLEEEIAQSFPLDEGRAPFPARTVLLRPFDGRPKEEPL